MKKIRTTLLATALIVSVASAAETDYELIVLGSNGAEATAFGINPNGRPCGYLSMNGTPTACYWMPNGSPVTLPIPAGDTRPSVAFAINNTNDIVGVRADTWSTGIFSYYKANLGDSSLWQYNPATSAFIHHNYITDDSFTRGLSENRVTCGKNSGFAYVWSPYANTGYNSFRDGSEFTDINGSGNATGMAGGVPFFSEKKANGTYEETVITQIGGGSLHGVTSGLAINDSNVIVGSALGYGFVWEPKAGTSTYLDSETLCLGINNAGIITGSMDTFSGMKACTWKKEGTTYVATDLNQFADGEHVLEMAFGINDRGQIVGRCRHKVSGTKLAFLLNPVSAVVEKLDSVSEQNVTLSWQGLQGRKYHIRYSPDVVTWKSFPETYETAGSNVPIVITRPRIAGPNMFFKVVDITLP